jgi:ATP-binding cassette subfamily B (MDR/TAP) protein 1
VLEATSLAAGFVIQHLTTFITCLILAFTRSWLLTLVTLSSVPVFLIIQGSSQVLCAPLLEREIQGIAQAGTAVERAFSAISTVKAFAAGAYEYRSFRYVLDRIYAVDKKLNSIWGFTFALGQFVVMAMFAQGFWFGAKLVREGKVSAGDVMTVLWACLIATSNLQMCIPQFITLTKGNFSMASLLMLAKPPLEHFKPVTHKIVPRECFGEFNMQNITFAYPTRPTVQVLHDVTLFFPANEMTFIVGASGSGKSTIAQLLLRIYQPQSGIVQLDNQDIAHLDEPWLRREVACISQDTFLFGCKRSR